MLAEDEICNVFRICGNTFMYCCILFSVISFSVVLEFSITEFSAVFNKMLAAFDLNRTSSGCQLPHKGKLFGTGNISLCSPTLNIKDIPTSA